ncbi:MAG: M15 family metallopeptidase [Gammaproteobacteria bacterium]|nr:M15 family metallopeptidase [Gammaproteobacteria bacterium]
MSQWPRQDPAMLNRFYGCPDAGSNGEPDPAWEARELTRLAPPYPMVLAWDTSTAVRAIRVHRLCAPALERALAAIAAYYGTREQLVRARMHLYGGCYNFRLMRGSTRLSTHSWGCAIDLDPDRNPLGRRWDPDAGMMPRAVVDIFRGEGATWGGTWRRPDAMHYQFADV